MCIIIINLKYFFSIMPTLLFHMFMSFFLSSPQHACSRHCTILPPLLVCTYCWSAACRNRYIYLHICIIHVHLFFLFFLRVIWEIKRRRTIESVCACEQLTRLSVRPACSLIFSFSIGTTTPTKKNRNEEEKCWPRLYMCAYFIWTYCHFRQTHFVFQINKVNYVVRISK